jgi:hypothetical protein
VKNFGTAGMGRGLLNSLQTLPLQWNSLLGYFFCLDLNLTEISEN